MDLTERIGFDLWLDPTGDQLFVGADRSSVAFADRTLGELRAVLAEPAAADVDPNRIAYRAARGVAPSGFYAQLATARLRYDLLLMPPGRFGPEFAKTAGHYHSRDRSGVGYPEVYDVLHGQATFVLQQVDDPLADEPMLRDVWVLECHSGDRVVIPPDCGHVTINSGVGPLLYATLVSLDAHNLYAPYARRCGAAVYVMAEANERVVPNPQYPGVLEPIMLKGARPELSDRGETSLLTSFMARPSSFRFLSQPDSADWATLWTLPTSSRRWPRSPCFFT